MKATMSCTLILCLAIMLAACDEPANHAAEATLTSVATYTPISSEEAIKLAKDTAKQLPSPPRTNNVFAQDWRKFTEVTRWPDHAGSNVGAISICGNPMVGADVCSVPITYTIILQADSSGTTVSFRSDWRRPGSEDGVHSWQFYISNDRHVDFKGERGDKLPSVPR